jgi:hypothetical protein
MNRFIAVKPVRFDRAYAVGDAIPGTVVDKRSVKRLIEAGRIAPAPDEGTPGDIKEGKEGIVAFLEGILGIDRDGQKPVEERADLCGEVIAELKNAVAYLKGHDMRTDGGGENRAAPEGAEPPQGDGDTGLHPDAESAQESTRDGSDTAPGAAADPPDRICPVCGKVCGSKAALTAHMKTHKTA